MPDRFAVLLDQNIPKPIASWLLQLKPSWTVYHTNDVDLSGKTDEEVFAWAQRNGALVISFDEDFADGRSFSARDHHGIVRLPDVLSPSLPYSDLLGDLMEHLSALSLPPAA